MTAWELYWLLKLDDIRTLFSVIMFACVVLTVFGNIFLWGFFVSEKEVSKKTAIRISSVVLVILIVFGVFKTVTPSTKQMAAIMVVPAIVSNEKVQELPNEVMELLGMSIDKAKEMLEPKK